MKKNRLLSALLALLMLAGSLTACATGDTPSDTQPDQTSSSAEEVDTALRDELPSDLDYGGDEITFISRYREGWTSGEISVPGLNSEPVNDAVFERNKAVEDRLNIEINNIEIDSQDYHEVPNKVTIAVQSGSAEYDIVAAPCITSLPTSLSGIYANLRETEYIDFEKPWWSQGFNEVVEYDGAQYAVTGSMVLSMYRFAFVTVFNQKLFIDANQTFLYDYVENGTWTLDKQAALVPLFHRDNGDGQQGDGDVFGFITGNHLSVDPYWSACDVSIMTKDEDGEYFLSFNANKLQEVMDKVLFLYYQTDDSTYSIANYGSDDEQSDIRDTFADGRGAMACLRIMELENASMRNMTDKYGVVPLPKFDEAQKDYYTYLHDQFNILTIPTTVKNERLDQVSAVMEAMASESYRVVRPTYYESTLRTKIAQDPQSAEMMEIVTNNIHIDAGILYTLELDWFYDHPRVVVKNKQNDTISHYKGVTKKTEKYINTISRKLTRIGQK